MHRRPLRPRPGEDEGALGGQRSVAHQLAEVVEVAGLPHLGRTGVNLHVLSHPGGRVRRPTCRRYHRTGPWGELQAGVGGTAPEEPAGAAAGCCCVGGVGIAWAPPAAAPVV